MPAFQMTPEALMALLGAIVSLLFSYFPVLRTKFAACSPEAKSGIMIGSLVVITAGLFGLGCAGLVNIGMGCDKGGIVQAGWSLAMALATNQGTWMATKNLAVKDVKAVKSGQLSAVSGQPEKSPEGEG